MSSPDPEREGGGDVPSREDGEQPPQLDVDTAFAAIVAGWADEPGDVPGPWPAAEDLDPPRHRGTAEGGLRLEEPGDDGPELIQPETERERPPGRPFTREPEILLPAIIRPSDDATADGTDERFVPPVPPPLPRGDLLGRLAWAGAIGGPLFLLIAVIVWQSAPEWLVLGAVAGFVGGFVTLVARMPRDRGEDDDDGAVV